MPRVCALIVAGGSGRRFDPDSTLPKQFVLLAGRTILGRTMSAFQQTDVVQQIVVVSHPDYIERTVQVAHGEGVGKLVDVVPGGSTRQASVMNGLQAIDGDDEDIVAIHDAARPLVEPGVIARSVEAAMEHGAADVVTQTVDTIVVADTEGFVHHIPPRPTLRNEQTPQTFRYGLIMKAHREALERGDTDTSDDVQLVLALKEKVRLVDGPPTNLKITTPQDLAVAERILAGR